MVSRSVSVSSMGHVIVPMHALCHDHQPLFPMTAGIRYPAFVYHFGSQYICRLQPALQRMQAEAHPTLPPAR